jgi:hypothetical protein
MEVLYFLSENIKHSFHDKLQWPPYIEPAELLSLCGFTTHSSMSLNPFKVFKMTCLTLLLSDYYQLLTYKCQFFY